MTDARETMAHAEPNASPSNRKPWSAPLMIASTVSKDTSFKSSNVSADYTASGNPYS